jgi:tetratricopeptide (TPR) repeat protein
MGNIGICLIRRGAYHEAVNMFDLQILNLTDQQNPEQMANALGNKSLALYHTGDVQEAMNTLRESIVILKTYNLQELVAERNLRLAIYLMNVDKYDSALNFLHNSLEYAVHPGHRNDEVACLALQAFGICYYSLGRYDETESFFERSNNFCSNESPVTLNYIINCLYIARVSFRVGDYKSAASKCRRVLKLFESKRFFYRFEQVSSLFLKKKYLFVGRQLYQTSYNVF